MKPPSARALPLLLSMIATLGSAAGGALEITEGVAAHQVLQRDAAGFARPRVGGTAADAAAGDIYVTVGQAGRPAPALAGVRVGTAAGGRWTAELPPLPTGGPYRLDFQLRDAAGRVQAEAAVDDILVGDLWLLIGQSNMQGQGRLADVEPPDPAVRLFDQADTWSVAAEPLHRPHAARDEVYRKKTSEDTRARRKGAGLGLPFAKEIHRHTGVPIGLVACALGGTAIAEWDPALAPLGGQSLYGATLRRVRAAGGRLKGALWYQGEADARNPEAVPLYFDRLRDLIAALRRDTGQPDLPFHLVQLCRMLDWIYFGAGGKAPPATLAQQWLDFREVQRQVAAQTPHTSLVATLDLDLVDSIHLDTPSLQRLGRRLAKQALRADYGLDRWQSGPRDPVVRGDFPAGRIYVRFAGVNGRLHAAGRVAGFELRRPDGSQVDALFRADVDPAQPDQVVIQVDSALPADARLVYGWGTNPYANLVDDADLAVPAFGPLALGPASGP
ncbi:MAG: sialate O-acetylesterase [Opitutaceae bacterium]|nr:sialate O-acetylesterase [Opitutaceae bacterium]